MLQAGLQQQNEPCPTVVDELDEQLYHLTYIPDKSSSLEPVGVKPTVNCTQF